MFDNLPRPAIYAHRGASAYAPENTLAAFELAIRQNADAIELDAALCADQQVIVFHDDTVERTTDGQGAVKELPLRAIKELDAGGSFDESFGGEKIPTLDEVFDAVGQDIFINVELKNYASLRDSLPEKVAQLVQKHNLHQRVLFSSFNPIALHRIKNILPDVPIGLLALAGFSGFWARSYPRRWLDVQAIHPDFQDTNHQFIKRKQAQGYRVNTYTVNRPGDIIRLAQWNVDGIITDNPLEARRALETESPPKADKT
jgi:glycerophosphoryl diester phosphodiesterase